MFAQSFANHGPSPPFIVLSDVDSTNNYAMAKLHAGWLGAGSCVMAISQHAGKGQRGRHWQSSPGQNITMSTVNQPPSYHPFIYSATVALACFDFISALVPSDVFIKWPNDLYIGDRKAGGILIENLYRGQSWEWAVAGIGINLNQRDFSGLENKAVSIAAIVRENVDLVGCAKMLHRHVLKRLTWLQTTRPEQVMLEYNERLYKKNQVIRLREGSIVFSTTIKSVTETGELICEDVIERSFNVGAVDFA